MTARDTTWGRQGGRIEAWRPTPIVAATGLPAGTHRRTCTIGHTYVCVDGDTSDCWACGEPTRPVRS